MRRNEIGKMGVLSAIVITAIVVGAIIGIGVWVATPTQPTEPSEDIKIHMVLYGYHDEGTWDLNHHEKLLSATTKLQAEEIGKFVITFSEAVSSEDAERIIETAAMYNDVVISTTDVYNTGVRMVSERYPDVLFLQHTNAVGKDPMTVISKDEYPQNVIIYGDGVMEQDYVLGAAAAKLMGPDTKMGTINAFDIPAIVNQAKLDYLGIQSVHPGTTVYHDFMGAFVNPVKTRDSVAAMVSLGASVVFIGLDDTSGVLEAHSRGIYAVPYFADLTWMFPDTIIGCCVWNFEPVYYDILKNIAQDNWDQLRNTKWFWEMTLANGGHGIGTWGNMVTPEVKEFAQDLIEKIISGEVVIPYDTEMW